MPLQRLLHAETTERANDSFYEVYRTLGYGFLESPYANALAVECGLRGCTVRREVPTRIVYKGVVVGTYRFDILLDRKVIVEVKSQKALGSADEHQLLNYLRATDIEVGLLYNFGPKPEHRRYLLTNDRKPR